MAWKTEWAVLVNGTDVTLNMRPYLMTVEVQDMDGTSSDTCRLSFDDSEGQCLLPPHGADIEVFLDGAPIFEGKVDSTPWRVSRGEGRVLTVSAKGFDTRGKAKAGQQWHLDDATLEDALGKAAEKAGFSVVVDPAFAAIKRAYWAPDGASFLAWGEKLARAHGATFKMRGTQAVFAKRGNGLSVTGAPMPTVTGIVGQNVISVDIDPSKGRPVFKQKRVRYFDRAKAQFMEKVVDVETGDASDAIDTLRWLANDEDHAQAIADGQKTNAEREAAVGSVGLTLTVTAQAEGTFVLTGARPGIDGTYRITGVTHRADRRSGSTTVLQLAQPQGEVGKDSRVAA
ncbi:MAG: late control D family protein [Fulvimarina manganoxydans]|uniref:phage late control D family protein n=1 Tax=Fulvimarina manganoxydans TaxID=937218 RepID=UPI0023541AF6|nr:late control D family protein [Fulvimarina manganoxydans]MCK5932072.1 late control D family protein [Fulvimarina manganoxydans]